MYEMSLIFSSSSLLEAINAKARRLVMVYVFSSTQSLLMLEILVDVLSSKI
jgi:hypothetical protein